MRDWTALAERLGSTAKTQRGAIRYLANRVNRSWLRRHLFPAANSTPPTEWRLAEECRTRNPDAKRARDDREFRRKFLARLRRSEAKLTSYDSTTLVGVLHRIDTDQSRRKAWGDLQECRRIVTGKGKTLPTCDDGVLVPVENEVSPRIVGAQIHLRGKNATIKPCSTESHHVHEDGSTRWVGGTPREYTRATNDNYVRSLALIVSPQRVEYVLHTTHVIVDLPDGYTWDKDWGLRVVHGVDDYHPDCDDLIAEDAPQRLVDNLHKNRERRRRLAKKQAVERAEMAGVWVCVRDSVNAGNCRVGTANYASKHHLDARRHYPAGRILDLANGDEWAVRLALKSAVHRHNREVKAGICHVSDHQ